MDVGLGLGSRGASAERFVAALGGLAPGSEVDRPGPVCAATCQPVVPSGVSSLRERFEAFWQGGAAICIPQQLVSDWPSAVGLMAGGLHMADDHVGAASGPQRNKFVRLKESSARRRARRLPDDARVSSRLIAAGQAASAHHAPASLLVVFLREFIARGVVSVSGQAGKERVSAPSAEPASCYSSRRVPTPPRPPQRFSQCVAGDSVGRVLVLPLVACSGPSGHSKTYLCLLPQLWWPSGLCLHLLRRHCGILKVQLMWATTSTRCTMRRW
jgi:hypothetical protein